MTQALVIVESPAKAKTIQKYLGEGFRVEASVGHVRDLPENAAQIPEHLKKLAWGRFGVNVEDGFQLCYVIPPKSKEQVRLLQSALKQADVLYLATDEDREGESIAWHLKEVLQPKVPVKRMVFNEITKDAIQRAVQNPRALDEQLVRAQEARRVVDRLYGYEVSPLLWKKVRPKLSAGRVQSVAVRLVVERERRRVAFVPASWWDLSAKLSNEKGRLDAALVQWAGARVANGQHFGEDGKLTQDKGLVVLDEAAARGVEAILKGTSGRVSEVEERPYRDRPAAPFTTSTLQQESNRKLRWTARRTMGVAQHLYENGWITYMRTDSTTLSAEALAAARSLIAEQYGAAFVPPEPRVYASKAKNAQEAHEAVRPAGSRFRGLDEAERELEEDHFRLYELIWKRTVASQMTDAVGKQVRIVVEADKARLQANGKTIEFPGFRRAYVEGSDNPDAELADQERILPPLRVGDRLQIDEAKAEGHETRPPARLTEATLVKELEARGIGRPSTYASIIDTILKRNYVFKKGGALVPTFTAFAVINLMEGHLGWLVDYEFTARMEEELDEIALGREQYVRYLSRFYSGAAGLQARLGQAEDRIDPREVCTLTLSGHAEAPGIDLRVGRYGPYLEHAGVKADVPEDLPPDELTYQKALELLAERKDGPKGLGTDPESGKAVTLQIGRFGPYVQLGEAEEVVTRRGATKKVKPQTAGLLRGMKPEEIDLETALKLLSLPRDLGLHPEAGQPVTVQSGPYGPYAKCEGVGTRSLPPEVDIFEISLAEALELFSQPQARGGSRLIGNDPVSGRAISVRQGRFGPYVTDGDVNASLPKLTDPHTLDLTEALVILEKKRAAGPSPAPRGAAGRRAKAGAEASPEAAPKARAKAAAGEGSAPRARAAASKPSVLTPKAAAKGAGAGAPATDAPSPDAPAKRVRSAKASPAGAAAPGAEAAGASSPKARAPAAKPKAEGATAARARAAKAVQDPGEATTVRAPRRGKAKDGGGEG
ncbi:MAG: topoisomerase 1 [Pseudomonadota bacterium]